MSIIEIPYVENYINSSAFPPTGNLDTLYIDQTANALYRWTGSTYESIAGGGAGSAVWGLITGTLSNQTDLINALNAKAGLSITNTFTKAQRGSSTALTDAATIAINLDLTNDFSVVLGGNRTLGFPTNFPTTTTRQTGTIDVRQDSTGSRTLAYAWCYIFPNGTAPILSTGKFAYDQLYYRVNSYATSTVTMTIATPCVVTWTAHGLVSGQRIQLTTTGALPTGLSASTTYWVNVIDANTFNLSSSLANLQAGTYIATSGSQSGVHTAVNASITISSNLGLA